ncbi:MAG: histidine kinase [Aetokthonos hydrillicola CCALA 1050]|nr:histidine kinase [Aetokthonos hydrillicola CCALA 1050]
MRNLTTPLILINTTLIVGAIGIFSYLLVRQLILEQIQAKALLQVHQRTDEIDQWLAVRKAEVYTLANTDTVRSLNWSQIEPYLRGEVRRIQEFFTFAVTYPDGSHYNTRIGNTHKNVKSRNDIRKALAGQNNISDPFFTPITRIHVVAIATPIRQTYDPASPPIAALNGNLTVGRVSEIINKLRYGEGSYAFALNSTGEPIIHPPQALMSTTKKSAKSFLESNDPNLADIARRMVNKQEGMKLALVDGKWKYVAHVPLEQANWSVALIIPLENIESQLVPLNVLASVLGGLLVIATIVAWQQILLTEQTKAQVLQLSAQEKTLQQQAQELAHTLKQLQQTQIQLVQTEKMSSLGQLVAGVAHEINNPISFISGNLTYARQYTEDLLKLVQLYQQHYPNPAPQIQQEAEAIELNFLSQDLPNLLTSMEVGTERIKKIVLSLRNFSRLDEAEKKAVNIHEGIDSALMILEHRFKAISNRPAIKVTKEYSELPTVECYPGQLNQVFMNILTNAIDAIEESLVENEVQGVNPEIRIWTKLTDDKHLLIGIADNGSGIPETHQQRLFDPFFTTKPIGKGTGLGLSISHQIITQKHCGKLQCISSPGNGAEFIIEIPVGQ